MNRLTPEQRFQIVQIYFENNGHDFHKRILFSDEAHFWLNGYVNKQTAFGVKLIHECMVKNTVTSRKTECLVRFMGWWNHWSVLLQNDEGHNVTVNGDRYRAMITNFFIPELNNHDVQELWIPTRRRNFMSHSSCHNRFIERHVW
ncbi:tc3a_0 protein [Trichonephila clavipes]|nr:tc3a_0 protein [Trichonephila clavipes]